MSAMPASQQHVAASAQQALWLRGSKTRCTPTGSFLSPACSRLHLHKVSDIQELMLPHCPVAMSASRSWCCRCPAVSHMARHRGRQRPAAAQCLCAPAWAAAQIRPCAGCSRTRASPRLPATFSRRAAPHPGLAASDCSIERPLTGHACAGQQQGAQALLTSRQPQLMHDHMERQLAPNALHSSLRAGRNAGHGCKPDPGSLSP